MREIMPECPITWSDVCKTFQKPCEKMIDDDDTIIIDQLEREKRNNIFMTVQLLKLNSIYLLSRVRISIIII